MKVVLKFLSFCCTLLLVVDSGSSNVVPFENCHSKYEVTSIDVPNCNTLPCLLKVDSNQDIIINMTSTEYIPFLKQKVFAVVRTIYYTIEGVKPDPCTEKMPCPISANKNISLKASFKVPDIPPFVGHIKWELKTLDDDMIVCFKIRVQILPEL